MVSTNNKTVSDPLPLSNRIQYYYKYIYNNKYAKTWRLLILVFQPPPLGPCRLALHALLSSRYRYRYYLKIQNTTSYHDKISTIRYPYCQPSISIPNIPQYHILHVIIKYPVTVLPLLPFSVPDQLALFLNLICFVMQSTSNLY